MSDFSLDDFKIMPDWVKEPADKNPYADYAGESPRESRGRGWGGNDRGGRGGGGGFGRNSGGGGGRGDRGPSRNGGSGGGSGYSSGGPRRDGGGFSSRPGSHGGPGGPGGAPRSDARPGSFSGGPGGAPRSDARPGSFSGGPRRDNRDNRGPGGPNRGPRPDRPSDRPHGNGGNGEPRPSRPDSPERSPDRAPAPKPVTVPLNIEFLPEPDAVAALAQQIKTSHRAYPLYGMARMFLNKPERHRVKVTSNAPSHPLFQIGEDGAVTTHGPAAERDAFRETRSKYYVEETREIEAPKGNFASVARCRLSGVLLGPTNHHGYQPALRRLFEARFSRRMDFNDFLRQIEVVNDPAVVEEWKQQQSRETVWKTTQEAEPVEFKTVPEVEAHFREHYLAAVLRTGKSLEMGGVTSRNVQDRHIREEIRAAWEKERVFPAQLVNRLRPHFQQAGLHIWKHRKRVLFVSVVRPVRFGAEGRSVSEQIAGILNIVEAKPGSKRADFYNQLLKPHEADPQFQKMKESLAADLHWLVGAGHLIEFHDGAFELPLAPREIAREEAAAAKKEPGATPEPSPESELTPSAESSPLVEPSPESELTPSAEPSPELESTPSGIL